MQVSHNGIRNNLTKGYVDLFRKIAQNNNVFPVSQAQNRAEYRRIIKLVPRAELEIPGITILYFEDFKEENSLKNKGLKKRLRTAYGHFLHIKNWRQLTIVSIPQSIHNRVLLLVEKKQAKSAKGMMNVMLKDYLVKIELEDNGNKAVRLSLRNEKYEHEVPVFLDKKNGKTRIRALSYKTYFLYGDICILG